jgi:hypothetical protein
MVPDLFVKFSNYSLTDKVIGQIQNYVWQLSTPSKMAAPTEINIFLNGKKRFILNLNMLIFELYHMFDLFKSN